MDETQDLFVPRYDYEEENTKDIQQICAKCRKVIINPITVTDDDAFEGEHGADAECPHCGFPYRIGIQARLCPKKRTRPRRRSS